MTAHAAAVTTGRVCQRWPASRPPWYVARCGGGNH
jgi:hypothetical protein